MVVKRCQIIAELVNVSKSTKTVKIYLNVKQKFLKCYNWKDCQNMLKLINFLKTLSKNLKFMFICCQNIGVFETKL